MEHLLCVTNIIWLSTNTQTMTIAYMLVLLKNVLVWCVTVSSVELFSTWTACQWQYVFTHFLSLFRVAICWSSFPHSTHSWTITNFELVKKRGGTPLLHMAGGPEANKNLDDLDEMEMEEDLVPARDALLDEMGRTWCRRRRPASGRASCPPTRPHRSRRWRRRRQRWWRLRWWHQEDL